MAGPDKKWIEHSNEENLFHLERQGRTSLGLMPFLGAGLSVAFDFKDWKSLLESGAPPHLLKRVKFLLEKNQYEEAAEALLKEFGADDFQNLVAASAGDRGLDAFDLREGTVSLLPLLASGPAIFESYRTHS